MKKLQVLEWLKRYLPAEIAGTLAALAAAILAKQLSLHAVAIAYAGSIAEAFGFYTTVFIMQLIATLKALKPNKERGLPANQIAMILAGILLEFGPAGIIDDLIVRPFFMYWFPILLGNFTWGILAGKIAGDICFYFFVILSYEFIKRKNPIKNNDAN